MRKIFAGATIFSLIGAALLGGVFAWTVSDHEDGQNDVGEGGIEIVYWTEYEDALLGPQGSDVKVAAGELNNVGDFAVNNLRGTVHATDVCHVSEGTQGEFLGCVQDELKCTTDDFGGDLWWEPGDGTGSDISLAAGDEDDGDVKFQVFVTMAADAPDTCQGATVSWEVWIEADTYDDDVHF
jgi:hypothetical protein